MVNILEVEHEAYIGRNWDYNKMFEILEFKRGFENQEIVYGAIQGAVMWSIIIGVVYG